jgi:hypothetical protein
LIGCLLPASALAAVVTVADVRAGSAVISPNGGSITVRATVALPNGCWTDPRVVAPAPGAMPDAQGVVSISVVADSSAGPGRMCSMIYRPAVAVRPLVWTHFPATGLKAIRLVGARTPFVAAIEGAANPH